MDIQFNAGNVASPLYLSNVRVGDYVFTAYNLADLQNEVVCGGQPEQVDKVFEVGKDYPIQTLQGTTWRYAYVLPRDEVQRDVALKWLNGDGALQVLEKGEWVDVDEPKWNAGFTYRIKPPASKAEFKLGDVVRIIDQPHIVGMVTAISENDKYCVGGEWYGRAELREGGYA